jgi:rod shape-determining protein MreC
METIFSRHRNLIVLVAVLFVQVIALAVQVQRPADSGARLIRVWAVSAVTPLEQAVVRSRQGLWNMWSNYVYLRGVRAENRALREQVTQLRLQQARVAEDAAQARRLQSLLEFKRTFVSQTMAAQVIGTTGSEQSRAFYIDKGSRQGIKPDMAVMMPDGIVGKVKDVFPTTSLVLAINDQSSGVGAILQKSRLQGILKGTPSGEIALQYVMSDETVEVGDNVLTSGGDRIFPKGLLIGTVTAVSPGRDLFLNIRVKPAAQLSHLEEVLVITKVDDSAPPPDLAGPIRAADILAERLPTVPPKPEAPTPGAPAGAGATGAANAPAASGANAAAKPSAGTTSAPNKPAAPGATAAKPSTAAGQPQVPAQTATSAPKPAGAANATKPVTPPSAKPAATGTPSASATTPKPAPGAPANAVPKAQATASAPKPTTTPAAGTPGAAGNKPATAAAGPKPQSSSVTPAAPKQANGTGATAPPKPKPLSSGAKPAARASDPRAQQPAPQPGNTETLRP